MRDAVGRCLALPSPPLKDLGRLVLLTYCGDGER